MIENNVLEYFFNKTSRFLISGFILFFLVSATLEFNISPISKYRVLIGGSTVLIDSLTPTDARINGSTLNSLIPLIKAFPNNFSLEGSFLNLSIFFTYCFFKKPDFAVKELFFSNLIVLLKIRFSNAAKA